MEIESQRTRSRQSLVTEDTEETQSSQSQDPNIRRPKLFPAVSNAEEIEKGKSHRRQPCCQRLRGRPNTFNQPGGLCVSSVTPQNVVLLRANSGGEFGEQAVLWNRLQG